MVTASESGVPLKHRERVQAAYRNGRGIGRAFAAQRDEPPAGKPRLAQLLLPEPVVAAHGQPFVLRIESPPATIGGGRVIGPSLRRLRRTDGTAIARLEHLRSNEPDVRLRGALSSLGMGTWSERRVCASHRTASRRSTRIAHVAGSLRSSGRASAGTAKVRPDAR